MMDWRNTVSASALTGGAMPCMRGLPPSVCGADSTVLPLAPPPVNRSGALGVVCVCSPKAVCAAHHADCGTVTGVVWHCGTAVSPTAV